MRMQKRKRRGGGAFAEVLFVARVLFRYLIVKLNVFFQIIIIIIRTIIIIIRKIILRILIILLL